MLSVLAMTLFFNVGSTFAKGESYKEDPKWVLTWEDWCLGKQAGATPNEMNAVIEISSIIAFESRGGSCLAQQEFLKYNLSSLVLKNNRISDFSPLISLLDANHLLTLNIRLTRPSQSELDKLSFLNFLPEFSRLFLPYSLNNDMTPRCPLDDVSKCY